MPKLNEHHYDIVIVGGGYVGLTSAISFAKCDFKVALIYKKIPSKSSYPSRLFAIASGSINIFEKLKVNIDFPNLGQKINNIRVTEGNSNDYLDFDPHLINEDYFGFMIEEHILHQELSQQVGRNPHITLYENFEIKGAISEEGVAYVTNSIDKIIGRVIIVADGKKSQLRNLIGIETYNKKYNQIAVVADIIHENSHKGSAHECFLPSGPLAVLPKKGNLESSIVWTLQEDYSNLLKNLSKEFIAEILYTHFGSTLGKINLKSEIITFPLELVYAKEYYSNRFVLLGDALHSIHPLAGQGLNLCLRDLKALHDIIIESRGLGLDLANKVMLQKYYNDRKGDNFLMYESTNFLNSLFSNNIAPIKFLRSKALSLINNIPSLKKTFMKYATGFTKI